MPFCKKLFSTQYEEASWNCSAEDPSTNFESNWIHFQKKVSSYKGEMSRSAANQKVVTKLVV